MNNTPSEAQEEQATEDEDNQSPPLILEEQGNAVNLNSGTRSDTVSSDELRVLVKCQNRHFTDPVNARRGSAISQTRADRLLASTKVEEMFKFFKGEVITHINGKCPNCSTMHKDESISIKVHEETPIRCRNSNCNRVFVSLGGSTSPPPLLRQCTLQEAEVSTSQHAPSQDQGGMVEFEFAPAGPPHEMFWEERPSVFGDQPSMARENRGQSFLSGGLSSDMPHEGSREIDTDVDPPTESVIETEGTTNPPLEDANLPQEPPQQSISRRNKWKDFFRNLRFPKPPFKFRSPVVRRTPETKRTTDASEREHIYQNEQILPQTALVSHDDNVQLPGGQPVEPGISRASTAVNDQTNDQVSTDPSRHSRASGGRRGSHFWRLRGCRCASCACPCHRGSHPRRSGPTSIAAEATSSEPQSSGGRKSSRPNRNAAASGNGVEVQTPFFPRQEIDWFGIRSTDGRSEAGE